MFDTPVTDLDPEATLTRVSHLTWMRNLLDAEELTAAAHWADLHSVLDRSPALPGAEQMIELGGDGTPAVAEFAPAELGAATGISYHCACVLIGDALDLRHRMPALWARVQAGEVKTWIARKIARTIRPLSSEAARTLDRVIAPYADRKTPGELEAFAEAEAARIDPDLARQRADAAARSRGAWNSPTVESGIGEMFIRADAADLNRFDQTLDAVAADLKTLGDETSKDERRAKAVGVLASPQLALNLHAEATGDASATRTGGGLPSTTVYVHLTDHAIRTRDGVARVEGIGPVLASQVKDWLRHDQVTIKPVIDLNQQSPVDGYEIPNRLRQAVHLLSPNDCFPYATNKTRRKDIDHTTPYTDTGPPGQTGIGNLAPMTRKHHRIKTFGRWKVKQPYPGILIWRSPHGAHYLVDNTGTRPITTAA